MTTKQIEIVGYDSNWLWLYQQEKIRLQSVLGKSISEIYHIGSTSIANMPARPVIDLLLEIENFDEITMLEGLLFELDYKDLQHSPIAHRSYLASREVNTIAYLCYLYEVGDPQIARHRRFCDYLHHHPQEAKQYADLKKQLALSFFDDVHNYLAGKEQIVHAIDSNAKHWAKNRSSLLAKPHKSSKEVCYWSEEKIIESMQENLIVDMTYFDLYINQMELIRRPTFTLINSGLDDDTFNCVLGANFTNEDCEKKIEEIIAYYNQRKIPFSWWVGPCDKPLNLPQLLTKAGLKPIDFGIGMYLKLDSWNMPEQKITLEIIKAKDEKTLHDFATIQASDDSAYANYFSWIAEVLTEDDPIEFFVGYINGKPVTRGSLNYYAHVAGIYYIATAFDELRKGYATAMQYFLLQRAKELGYHIAVLQSSDDGLPLYSRIGFMECCQFKEFKNEIG